MTYLEIFAVVSVEDDVMKNHMRPQRIVAAARPKLVLRIEYIRL